MTAQDVVRTWLEESGLEWERGARPGEFVVQLPGEAKLRTTVSLLVGDQGLSASAFVVRHPDENHEAFYRWLLTRNSRLPGIAFGLDALGDVYLVGRIPVEGVTQARDSSMYFRNDEQIIGIHRMFTNLMREDPDFFHTVVFTCDTPQRAQDCRDGRAIDPLPLFLRVRQPHRARSSYATWRARR